jgi:hypothetical protein
MDTSPHRKRTPSVRPMQGFTVLEAAVDTLPETYRTVFMLRDIEGLSTSETGQAGPRRRSRGRLHRARHDPAGGDSAIGEVAAGRSSFMPLRSCRVGGAGSRLSMLVTERPSRIDDTSRGRTVQAARHRWSGLSFGDHTLPSDAIRRS